MSILILHSLRGLIVLPQPIYNVCDVLYSLNPYGTIVKISFRQYYTSAFCHTLGENY